MRRWTVIVVAMAALAVARPAAAQLPSALVLAHQYGEWRIAHVTSVLHVQASGALPVAQSGVWNLAHLSSVLHVAGTGQGTFPATQSGTWTVAHVSSVVHVAAASPLPVTQSGAWAANVQHVSAALHVAGTVAGPFYRITQTFTATGNGTVLDATAGPAKSFTIQVTGTGAAPTSWDVRAEGSLNNSGFTQILQHTDTTGNGIVLYSGSTLSPSLYLRIRVAGLVLGTATNIVVVLLGVQ